MSLDLVDEVVRRLSTAKAPLGYAKLSEALVKKSKGITEEVLKQAVSEAMNDGRAFHWGNYARSKQCYWQISREQWLSKKILETCSAIAQTPSEVRIRGFSSSAIRAAINELISTGRLQRYPGIGQERARIGVSPQTYAAALQEFVMKKLEKANIPKSVFFPSAAGGPDANEPHPPGADYGRSELPMTERILEELPKLERRGLPVASVVLRRSLSIHDANKQDFDRAVVRLSELRKVYLSAHHDAHGLSATDRDNLIDGGDGRYYVAVTLLRQS